MSSTEVAERPIFKVASYLNELIRRQQRRAEDADAGVPVEPSPTPIGGFILPDDEIVECEVES